MKSFNAETGDGVGVSGVFEVGVGEVKTSDDEFGILKKIN